MKTSRTDVIRDKRQTICPNSSRLGYSTSKLKFGEFFRDNTGQFAKCHGRVKRASGGRWYVLAQVAAANMQYSMERWINAEDVVETIPADRCNKHIAAFFTETEDYFDEKLINKSLP